MYDIRSPGAHFILGHLCLLRRTGEAKAIGSWPKLEAFRRRGARSAWKPFTPGFRLIAPGDTRPPAHPMALPFLALTPPGEPDDGLVTQEPGKRSLLYERRRRAFSQFRSTFPERVARCTERFPSRHWRLLVLLRQRIEAVDLAEQNPALAFCLANRQQFGRAVSLAWTAEVSKRKQREIMGWLGFPDRQGAARIMSRIVPEAVHVRSMRRLRRALKNPVVCKLLAHTPSIHAGVLGLVCERRILPAVTPRLVAEVAVRPEEMRQSVTAQLLVDFEAMARHLRWLDLPRAFHTIRRLREVHDELARDFSRRRHAALTSYEFPPPPLPGTHGILPLCTPRDLIEEGAEQHHCVATYIPRVAAGGAFIYRVWHPERATLSLVPHPGGGWQVGTLVLSFNRDPAPATREHVETWLIEHMLTDMDGDIEFDIHV